MRSQLAAALHLQPLWKSEGRGQWWSHGGEPAEGGGLPPQLEPDPGLRRGAHRSRRPFHGGRRRDRSGGQARLLPPRHRQGRGSDRPLERHQQCGQALERCAQDQRPPPPDLLQERPDLPLQRHGGRRHRRGLQPPLPHDAGCRLRGQRRPVVRRRGRHLRRCPEEPGEEQRDHREVSQGRPLCDGGDQPGGCDQAWGVLGSAPVDGLHGNRLRRDQGRVQPLS
mmetsp:Transcript_3057/g.8325  ORF Transcript_3057/g.8325 Transcript_3057/m.8325 type:complete len:224 (+) Transcript_3057:2166-2837(+)